MTHHDKPHGVQQDVLTSCGAFHAMPQDAGISKMPGYKAYDEGNAAGIWIRDYKGQPYVGQVR